MNFSELFAAIKTKFQEHPEIMLNREELSVEIADVFDDRAFYILWKDQKCKVEPFHYHDHNVKIVASLRDIELLFTERQYLFLAHRFMNVSGSFNDVMAFQEMLSYITKDNSYVVQEEIISKMLMKQDQLREDIGIVMQSLQLLLTNSLTNQIPTPTLPLVSSNNSSETIKASPSSSKAPKTTNRTSAKKKTTATAKKAATQNTSTRKKKV